jgi:hypothetical protein
LDERLRGLLPVWEHADSTETIVAAPPERAIEGVREASLSDMPITAMLLVARALPGILTRRRSLHGTRRTPLYEVLVATPGFVPLDEGPRFLVAGYVGQPWRPIGGHAPVSTPDGFACFDEPGYAKVVTYFDAEPAESGSTLRTETRIHLTDDHARHAFRAYWLVVRWGSMTTRKDWLRAVRKRAEQD